MFFNKSPEAQLHIYLMDMQSSQAPALRPCSWGHLEHLPACPSATPLQLHIQQLPGTPDITSNQMWPQSYLPSSSKVSEPLGPARGQDTNPASTAQGGLCRSLSKDPSFWGKLQTF